MKLSQKKADARLSKEEQEKLQEKYLAVTKLNDAQLDISKTAILLLEDKISADDFWLKMFADLLKWKEKILWLHFKVEVSWEHALETIYNPEIHLDCWVHDENLWMNKWEMVSWSEIGGRIKQMNPLYRFITYTSEPWMESISAHWWAMQLIQKWPGSIIQLQIGVVEMVRQLIFEKHMINNIKLLMSKDWEIEEIRRALSIEESKFSTLSNAITNLHNSLVPPVQTCDFLNIKVHANSKTLSEDTYNMEYFSEDESMVIYLWNAESSLYPPSLVNSVTQTALTHSLSPNKSPQEISNQTDGHIRDILMLNSDSNYSEKWTCLRIRKKWVVGSVELVHTQWFPNIIHITKKWSIKPLNKTSQKKTFGSTTIKGTQFLQENMSIQPWEKLVLFSPWLVQQKNSTWKDFWQDGVINALRKSKNSSSDQCMKNISDALTQHTWKTSFDTNIIMMVVEFDPKKK